MTKLGARRIHPVRTRGGNLKHRALRLESGNYAWGSEHTTRKTRIIGVVYNATNNELVRTNTLVKGCVVQIDAAPFRQWYEAHYGQAVVKKGRVRCSSVLLSVGLAAPYTARRTDRAAFVRLPHQPSPPTADLPDPLSPLPAHLSPAPHCPRAPRHARVTSHSRATRPQSKEALAAVTEEADKKSNHVKRTIAERQKEAKVDPLLESQFAAGRLYAVISSRPGQSGRADGYILEGKELEFYIRRLRAGKAKHA